LSEATNAFRILNNIVRLLGSMPGDRIMILVSPGMYLPDELQKEPQRIHRPRHPLRRHHQHSRRARRLHGRPDRRANCRLTSSPDRSNWSPNTTIMPISPPRG
jgi:hypothetical protein